MPEQDIAVLTDSTANLTEELLKQHNIQVMPLRVNWPGEEIESFQDPVGAKTENFYQRLKASKDLPTTSQPSPGEFMAKFAEIGKTSKQILAIFVSDKISGTLKSAQFALNMAEDVEIELIDSRSSGVGLGLLALKAAELVENGKSLPEAAAMIREYVKSTRAWLTVDNLEYLHKGGRLSGTRRMLGTILDMKPLLHIVDGELELFGTVRSLENAMNSMLDFVEVEAKNRKRLWIGLQHADNPAMAARMEEEVRRRYNPEMLFTSEFSPVLGVHMGPGALALAHLGDE